MTMLHRASAFVCVSLFAACSTDAWRLRIENGSIQPI